MQMFVRKILKIFINFLKSIAYFKKMTIFECSQLYEYLGCFFNYQMKCFIDYLLIN